MCFGARDIFCQAVAFEQAADVMYQHVFGDANGPVPNMTPEQLHRTCPLVVMEALAVELYLKCLSQIERSGYRHGHDLRLLFDDLSAESRASIRRHYDEIQGTLDWEPVTLDEALDRSADAFIEFRYVYETKGQTVFYCAGVIATAAKLTITALHPDWA
jgi:hypothetical protein